MLLEEYIHLSLWTHLGVPTPEKADTCVKGNVSIEAGFLINPDLLQATQHIYLQGVECWVYIIKYHIGT